MGRGASRALLFAVVFFSAGVGVARATGLRRAVLDPQAAPIFAERLGYADPQRLVLDGWEILGVGVAEDTIAVQARSVSTNARLDLTIRRSETAPPAGERDACVLAAGGDLEVSGAPCERLSTIGVAQTLLQAADGLPWSTPDEDPPPPVPWFSPSAALIVVWLLLFLAVAAQWTWQRCSNPSDTRRVGVRWQRRAIVEAIVLGVVTVGVLSATSAAPVFGGDLERDFLEARQLETFGLLAPLESRSALGALKHGTAWPRFLGLSFTLGLDPAGIQFAAFLATGLAVAFFRLLLSRRLSSRLLGTLSGGVFGVVTVGLATSLYLWTPTLQPLPSVLFLAALLPAIATKDAPWSLAAGLAAGLLADVHAVGAMYVLPAIVLLCWLNPRPVLSLARFLVAATAVPALLSTDALLSLVTASPLSPEGAGFFLVIGALALGGLLRRVAPDVPRWLHGPLILFVMASPMLVGVVPGGRSEARYLVPGAPALVALVAVGADLLVRSVRSMRAACWAASVLLVAAPGAFAAGEFKGKNLFLPPHYALEELRVLSTEFASLGYSYPDLLRRLRGPGLDPLLAGVLMFGPWDASSAKKPLPNLRVLEAALVGGPPGATRARPRSASDDQPRFVIQTFDSWFDDEGVEVCCLGPGGDVSWCERPRFPAVPSDELAWRRSRGLRFLRVSDPRPCAADGSFQVRLPVSTRGPDVSREVRFLPRLDGCPPTAGFTAVEGLPVEGPLPADRVRLLHATDQRGWLVLNVPNDRRCFELCSPLRPVECGASIPCPYGEMREIVP